MLILQYLQPLQLKLTQIFKNNPNKRDTHLYLHFWRLFLYYRFIYINILFIKKTMSFIVTLLIKHI